MATPSRINLGVMTPAAVRPGHQYSTLAADGHAQVQLGDVYHQNIVLDQGSAQLEVKSLGVCLGNAPHISSESFKGRDDELDILWTHLKPTHDTGHRRIVSIVGTGGVGKTQLSLAYTRKYGHHYSSVFWINASEELTLRRDLASLTRNIFPDSAHQSYKTPETEKLAIERVQRWLSQPPNSNWLLLFDNYDNPHFSESQSSCTHGFDIRPFLPISSQGSVIITTRSTKIFYSEQLRLRSIEDLSTSISILAQRSQRDLSNDPEALELAKRLGGLPLALVTAGTFLASSTTSCAEYRHLYESIWTRLLDTDSEELSDYPKRTLSTTWTISLEYVRAQDDDAAELLQFLAYFSPRDIWYELLEASASSDIPWLHRLTRDEVCFQQAVSKLRECCLIDVVAGSYQLHPCLHDWLVGKLSFPPEKITFLAAVTGLRDSIPLHEDPKFYSKCYRLSDHVAHLQSRQLYIGWNAYFDDPRAFESASHFGILQRNLSLYVPAEKMCQLALNGYEKAFGLEDARTIGAACSLSIVYRNQYKLDMSEAVLRRALSKALKTHQLMIRGSLRETLDGLRVFYQMRGAVVGKQQTPMDLQENRKRIPHSDRVSILGIVNELGLTYIEQRKLVESKWIVEWLLAVYSKDFREDDIDLATTMIRFSDAFGLKSGPASSLQGMLTLMKDYALQEVVRMECTHGAEHHYTLMAIQKLGTLAYCRGESKEAETMLTRALAGMENAFGLEHNETLYTYTVLGRVHREQRELDKAEYMFTRALAGMEKTLGSEHPGTLGCLHYLGSLRMRQGDYKEAENFFTSALTGLKDVLGEHHTKTLSAAHGLANAYFEQLRYLEAESLYLQVVAGYTRALGAEHNKVLKTLKHLEELYNYQGKRVAAKQLQKRISDIEGAETKEARKSYLVRFFSMTVRVWRRLVDLVKTSPRPHDRVRRMTNDTDDEFTPLLL